MGRRWDKPANLGHVFLQVLAIEMTARGLIGNEAEWPGALDEREATHGGIGQLRSMVGFPEPGCGIGPLEVGDVPAIPFADGGKVLLAYRGECRCRAGPVRYFLTG